MGSACAFSQPFCCSNAALTVEGLRSGWQLFHPLCRQSGGLLHLPVDFAVLAREFAVGEPETQGLEAASEDSPV